MTQNESCDIRQLYVVELVVGSEQKLYFCVTIPIKTIVIERVRRVLPQQNTPSVKYNRVISRCMWVLAESNSEGYYRDFYVWLFIFNLSPCY